MAMNETLSPKQARSIITNYDMILSSTVRQMRSAFEDFANTLKDNWEDKYAVEFSHKMKEAISQCTDNLNKNVRTFNDSVRDICDAYATTGGMGGISIPEPAPLTGALVIPNSIDLIKETFDGDEFGFKKIGSEILIIAAITKLKSTMSEIISETNSQLSSINAFGNMTVQLNIAKSAGKIIEILQEAVADVEELAKTNVTSAAEAYGLTGKSAETAADIQKG